MDKEPDEVNEFVKKLHDKFRPEEIILFGSRAKGTEWKRSDYDFIIVSKGFEGMHWLNRISEIVKLWEPMVDIDVLPYTPKEFEDKKKNSSTVRTALKEGKKLAMVSD
ncbi:MAG: nucleotidyltransferase domain-containing protein [Nanobdellota archaeon]